MSGDEVDLRALAAEGVKRALSRGADAAEVFALETRMTTFLALGDFLTPSESLHEGFAVRVVVGGKLGQSSSPGLTNVDLAIEGALSAARAKPVRFPAASPERVPLEADPVLVAGEVDRLGGATARLSERLSANQDVTFSRVDLKSSRRRIGIANSAGLEASDESVNERVEMEVRVTRGTSERTAFDSWSGVRPAESAVDLDALADDAIAQARAALDAQPLPGGTVDEVILAPGPASQLLGIFSASFSGMGAEAGKSPLADRLGERVVSELLTMVDRPHDLAGRGRRSIDDEGTPTRDVTLVERGALKAFVHNLASSQAAGVAPTGHGIRRGIEGGVGARPINLVVAPGDCTFQELVEGAQRAVIVNQPLMGAFVASRVTGDFSLVAPFAFYVEGGRLRHALPPTTVGGNAHRVLQEVRQLGRERRTFIPGTMPGMRAGGVSCAT